MRRRVAALCLAAALAVGASGCGPSHEEDEAKRVLELIDTLRGSSPRDDDTRLAVATALGKLAVTSPAAVRARDACAKAYGELAQANQASAQAMEKMAADQKADAARVLVDAESHLDTSKATMPECSDATAALRRVEKTH